MFFINLWNLWTIHVSGWLMLALRARPLRRTIALPVTRPLQCVSPEIKLTLAGKVPLNDDCLFSWQQHSTLISQNVADQCSAASNISAKIHWSERWVRIPGRHSKQQVCRQKTVNICPVQLTYCMSTRLFENVSSCISVAYSKINEHK